MGLFAKGRLTRHFYKAAGAAALSLAAVGVATANPPPDTPAPRAAQIEWVTSAQQKNLAFTRHGEMASELAAWRASRDGAVNVKPYLVDLDPYDFSPALQTHLDENRFASISSQAFGDLIVPDAASADTFWKRNDTLIVLPAGNDGNSVAGKNYEPSVIHKERYSAYMRGDTVLRVGSVGKDGVVAPYSSENNADFLFANGFDEGFCGRFYMNKHELDALRAAMPPTVVQSIEGQPLTVGHMFRALPDADQTICAMNGTSFSSPNLAGYLLAKAQAHPGLNNYDLTVTSLLAAAHDAADTNGKAQTNAAGFRFNAAAGLGVFDTQRHAAMIAKLESERSAQGEAESLAALRAGAIVTGGATEAEINDDLCVTDTNVEMIISAAPRDNNVVLPTEAVLTSPSGTSVTLKLKRDKWRATADGRYRLAADVSYFLGENTKGKWSLAFSAAAAGTAAISRPADPDPGAADAETATEPAVLETAPEAPPAETDTAAIKPRAASYKIDSFEVAHWATSCSGALGRTIKFAVGR